MRVIVSSAPMVGIFWIGPNGIIHYGEPAKSQPVNYAGFKDSPYDHIDKWTALAKTNKDWTDKEYFDVPRGRVLYNTSTRKFRIMSSNQVLSNQSTIAAICRAFSIPIQMVELVQDMHYELEPNIDWDD